MSTKEIILGHNCDIVDIEVPIWYSKEEMFSYLTRNNYSKEIAEELSQLWVNDLQSSFRKGFEKGFQYAKGKDIDVVVKVRDK